MQYEIGDYVWVMSIDEKGIISEICPDSSGCPIYVIILDGGFKTHLCRESEFARALT